MVERGLESGKTWEAMAKALSVPVAKLLIEPEVGTARSTPLKSGRRPKGSVPPSA